MFLNTWFKNIVPRDGASSEIACRMNCAIEKKNSAAYQQELTVRMEGLEWCPSKRRPVGKMYTLRELASGARLRWEYKYTEIEKMKMMQDPQPNNSFAIANFIKSSFAVSRSRFLFLHTLLVSYGVKCPKLKNVFFFFG